MTLTTRRLLLGACALTCALSSAWTLAAEPKLVRGVEPAFMDPKTPACQDFYGHANGAYDKEPIPAAYAAFGVNQEIDDRNWAILRDILESAASDPGTDPVRRRIGAFYASGMDEAGIAAAGLTGLADLLGRIDRLKTAQELPLLVGHLHRHGIRPGWIFWVTPDDKDSAHTTAVLMQGGLGMPERGYYFPKDDAGKALLAKYRDHVARTLALAGDPTATATERAGLVLAVETGLAEVSRTMVQLRDPEANYHKLARAEWSKLGAEFDWTAYLTAVGVPASEPALVVGQPEYLQGFARLTRSQPIAAWQAYLRWQVIRASSAYLDKRFEEEDFAFYGKTLSGRSELLPRWKRVLSVVDHAIGQDLGRAYVQRAFSAEAKQRVVQMVAFHKQALQKSIARSTWMGEATRAQALRKLSTLQAMVGYPEVWRDYSGLAVSRQSYVGNWLSAQAFEVRRQIAKLGKPTDRSEWYLSPQTNNAYYEPTTNQIVLPAGILQPPFFDAQASDAVNYGALASTIGHELLHALDDQGSQYDADGNLKNWWTQADRKAYDAMTQKVVAQYDAYEPVPGGHILGEQTLGENLADIGGLKIAFEAWQLATAAKKEPQAHGMTPEQLFFVAFAQGWRTNERKESVALRLKTDFHSPPRFRVNGSAAALAVFSAAFGCQAGQPMFAEPSRRFDIW